jgi:uncharacterized LabA/DUF88 family protein
MKPIAVFIDGSNAYATAKALGKDIDYKALRRFFEKKGDLLRMYYYTALLPGDQENTLRPLVDWLQYNGYEVVTKDTKEFIDASGRKKIKGNMDIEIAVDALELANNLSDVYLFSGDGDFECLVRALQKRGVRVTVISSIKVTPPMCADSLRRVADYYIDLADLDSILRTPERRSYANA